MPQHRRTRLAQTTAYGGFVRPTTTVGAKASQASTTALICSTIDVSPAVGVGPRKAVFVRNALLTSSSHRVEVTDSSGRVELDAIVTTR